MGSGAGEGLTLESLHLGRQQLQVRKGRRDVGREGGKGGREGGMVLIMRCAENMKWNG